MGFSLSAENAPLLHIEGETEHADCHRTRSVQAQPKPWSIFHPLLHSALDLSTKRNRHMHEKQKLAEARYFLERLSATTSDLTELRFLVSAFLTSARSVLQYALEEARKIPGGRDWFAGHARVPEVKFLKELRDANIHAEPVAPIKAIGFMDRLSVSAQLMSITLTDADGTVHHGVAKLDPPNPSRTSNASSSDTSGAQLSYRFDGWQGGEDVPQLCACYLSQLEAIVSDGEARGFLSGKT